VRRAVAQCVTRWRVAPHQCSHIDGSAAISPHIWDCARSAPPAWVIRTQTLSRGTDNDHELKPRIPARRARLVLLDGCSLPRGGAAWALARRC
jgi:hypothetical protein